MMQAADSDTVSHGPDTTADASSGALKGLRILDLSRVLAGPWASQILGDLGAEVIKVEQPDSGDDTRAWGPPFLADGDAGPDERFSAYFLGCNRNKRSIAVDIANPKGAALIRALAKDSDVVLENFRVGALERYGLDYASLATINPALVYCSITGFGQSGPLASRPGYDFVVQGMGGLMSITGQPEGTPGAEPMKVGVAVSDIFTGLYATISILAALRHRDATGEGQHLDCALLDTQVAVLANQAMNWLVGGMVPKPMGNLHPNVVPYRTFPTRDGHAIVATGNDRQFHALCRLLGLEQMTTDPRFLDNASRVAYRAEVEKPLGDAIAGWATADFIAAMAEAGVPGGPINRIDQVFEQPQIAARGLVQEMRLPSGTSFRAVGFPVKLSATPATYRAPPPALGAQTGEVLQTLLNLSETEVSELRAAGVVGG